MIFQLLIFISAFLLFAIQPAIAKSLLPLIGGTSISWITCLLFFQSMLLIGYSLNLIISRTNKLISLIFISLLFTSHFFLFHKVETYTSENLSSTIQIIKYLFLKLGLISILLSFTSPFIQKVINKKNSYSLYSLSNFGSLTALITYPFIVETYIGLDSQFNIFNIVSIIYFIIFCLAIISLKNVNFSNENAKNIKFTNKFKILLLSAICNSLLIITTNNLSLQFAEAPFIWIFPLLLFLIAYIFGFLEKEIIPKNITENIFNYSLIILPLFFIFNIKLPFFSYLLIVGILNFVITYKLVREIYELRPETQKLDLFYILLSFGGLIGTVFTGIITSLIFSHYAEIFIIFSLILVLKLNKNYKFSIILIFILCILDILNFSSISIPLTLLTSLYLLAIIISTKVKNNYTYLSFACLLFLSLNYLNNNLKYSELISSRNLYGIKKVKNNKNFNFFFHGKTIHGIQNTKNLKKVYTYASKNSGIYDVINHLKEKKPSIKVLVIGLGIGHVASYSRDTDSYTFIELDPSVLNIASNTKYFTYLNDCKNCITIIGDGRIELSKLSTKYDLILVDAFTSGSVPLHLLTREALEIYFSKLKTDGVIAFNISHSYYDLNKALISNSKELEYTLISKHYDSYAKYEYLNIYSIIAKKENDTIRVLMKNNNWNFYKSDKKLNLWTDNRSSLIDILN